VSFVTKHFAQKQKENAKVCGVEKHAHGAVKQCAASAKLILVATAVIPLDGKNTFAKIIQSLIAKHVKRLFVSIVQWNTNGAENATKDRFMSTV
jgi:hypothetical protein